MILKIGLCVLTYKPAKWVERQIASISQQTLRPDRLLVIDTETEDRSCMRFQSLGAEIHTISPRDFDHGGTRQLAVELLGNQEIIIFLTQDAILSDENALQRLVEDFDDEQVGLVFGRQCPREGANAIERHARLFNYPDESYRRGQEDVPVFGFKTAFCSDSFAAYRVADLVAVGGFPPHVICTEDMHVAARLIHAGKRIAYRADATVFHSHELAPLAQFRRYFDVGVFHCRNSWIRETFGTPDGEGLKFLLSEVAYLWKHTPGLIPRALLLTLMKFVGFKSGLLERRLGRRLSRMLSDNKGFWGGL